MKIQELYAKNLITSKILVFLQSSTMVDSWNMDNLKFKKSIDFNYHCLNFLLNEQHK